MERKCVCCPAVFVVPTGNPGTKTCSPECREVYRLAVKRAWENSPHGRERNRAGCAKYRKTAKGRKTRNACNRVYQKTPQGKATNRKTHKTYYLRKKAMGLCVRSGCWRKAKKGHVRCRACYLAENERLKAYAQSKKAAS